jgi:hypothetical protein
LSNRALALLAAATAFATTTLADTLVLRSGRRIDGDLVSVRGSTVEFAETNGSTRRYDRSDVARIELNSPGSDEDDARPGGRPSGMREKYTAVQAATAWNDTGVDVRSGALVYFEATGRLRWGPDRQDGPGGEGGNRYNANRPIPGRPGGALIGRIGDSDPFYIGDNKGPIRTRAEGRLSLGVNDDYLQDNTGSWRVTIYY